MRNVWGWVAVVGFCFTLSHEAAAGPAANLLNNGSFETYANGAFTGWTNGGTMGVNPSQYAVQQPTDGVTPGQYGDVVSPDPFTFSSTPAGTHAAYFVADQADMTLSQAVHLTVGQSYTIGFDLFQTLSGARNSGGFTITGAVGDSGSSMTVATASSSSLAPAVWTHFEKNFVASSSDPIFTFEFASQATPASDVLVDGVYLATAVPEPASLAVLGVGLVGLWSLRRMFAG